MLRVRVELNGSDPARWLKFMSVLFCTCAFLWVHYIRGVMTVDRTPTELETRRAQEFLDSCRSTTAAVTALIAVLRGYEAHPEADVLEGILETLATTEEQTL